MPQLLFTVSHSVIREELIVMGLSEHLTTICQAVATQREQALKARYRCAWPSTIGGKKGCCNGARRGHSGADAAL